MGTIDSNVLLPAAARRSIQPDAVIDIDQPRTFYRPKSGYLISYQKKCGSDHPAPVQNEAAQMDGMAASRIKELEMELMYYRGRIEELASQRTERLNRRISILESCNSNLNENYHKMYQMYIALLVKTQNSDAGADTKRALPGCEA